jgi:LysM repeat protein
MRNQSHIILLLAALLALVTGAASAESYKVRKGDSLDRIAKKRHVAVEALREANGLESDALKPGMRLTIPAKGKASGESPAVGREERAPAAEASAPATEWVGYHTVRKGDTLESIAESAGLTVGELKKLNSGKGSRRLKAGTKLRIKSAAEIAATPSIQPAKPKPQPHPVAAVEPRPAPKAPEAAVAAAPSESAAPPEDKASRHTVRKGDTFATIAKGNGLSIGELKELNPGKDSRRLKIGMQLRVRPAADAAAATVVTSKAPAPVPPAAKAPAPVVKPQQAAADPGPAWHTVRKGDTFATIAKANALSLNDLKALNPGKNSRRLKIGMQLRVNSGADQATAPETASALKADTRAASKKTARVETPAADPVAAEPVAAAAAKPVYHKVRKGETFASIASKYGVSVKSLKKLNQVRKTKRLKPGSRLLVRRGEGGGTVTADRRRELEQILRNEASLTAEGAALAAAQVGDMAPELLASAADNALGGPIVEENVSPGITDRVIRVAKLMLDLPYRFGGTSLTGIDCSGYVQKVFGFLNLPLPRTAREQFARGMKIDKEELATGDLVFFQTYARFPSHVGIYLGDNKFIHASSGDRKVKIDSLDAPYFLRRYIGARRLVNDQKDSEE